MDALGLGFEGEGAVTIIITIGARRGLAETVSAVPAAAAGLANLLTD